MFKLKFKKILILFTLVTMIFSNCVYVSHADTVDKNITIIVDGTALSLDVAPVIVNGRVLLPLRSVFGAFNIEPQWDGNTKTVTANTPNMDMVLPIGSKVAFINGAVVELDVPAMIINGRTMVPVRFISEQLGATVVWDAYNYTVNITKSEVVAQIPTGETQPVITPPIVEAVAKEGKINIVSISPGENLIEGERVDLSVRVDYTFKGLSAAAIDISINNDMITESNVILDKRYIAYESGSYTFNVNVLVEDIQNLGKLKINTCISEYSTGLAWNPVAKSEYSASIMKKVLAPLPELQSGIYSIKQADSNLSLDVANYGNVNGTNIQLANYVGNTAQKFKVEKLDGAYRIWSVCSPNLVVDIGGDDYSTRKHGTNIDLWKLNTNYTEPYWKDQEWTITSNGDGTFKITAKHYPELVMGSGNGNVMLVNQNNSDTTQKWIFESVDAPVITSVPGADVAIEWAVNEMNNNNTDFWKNFNCVAFVFRAYKAAGVAKSSYAYATLAANALMTNPGDLEPPKGALLFYDYNATLDGEYKNWGHIAIYIGDGKAIHAFGKKGIVIAPDAFNIGLNYKGWGIWK